MITGIADLINRLTAATTPLRPPGAVAEPEFLRRCIRCNKCVQVCDYQSIRTAHLQTGARFGTPVIEPRSMPCYLCMKCPPVCPTGALDPRLVRKEDVDMGVAVIDELACFAHNGIVCRACFERCPIYRRGITLEDEMYPHVDPEACVGCGVCENVCPLDAPAIRVVPRGGKAGRRA